MSNNCASSEQGNKPKSIFSKLPGYARDLFGPLFETKDLEPITGFHEPAQDTASATVVYPIFQQEAVLNHLLSHRPGLKIKYQEVYQATKELKKLGCIIPESLPRWHASKTSLPPCKKIQVLTCKLNKLRNRVAPG